MSDRQAPSLEPREDEGRVGPLIRTFRLRRRLTLAQLSSLSGISVGHLSRLENGTREPTVRLLLQLARALGVSIGTLVGESDEAGVPHVSRGAERQRIAAQDTLLAALSDPAMRGLQAVELVLAPGRLGETAAHAGEEWIYVVSGTIEADVNGRTVSLGAGDAIQFRAEVPHALGNPSAEAATVLVVNTLGASAERLSY